MEQVEKFKKLENKNDDKKVYNTEELSKYLSISISTIVFLIIFVFLSLAAEAYV